MSKVFVDTNAWIALLNTGDNLHTPATQVRRLLGRQKTSLVTSEFVLIEFADSMAAPAWRMQVANTVAALRRLPNVRVIPMDQVTLNEAWALYAARPDKGWSLTDCASFVLMQRERIQLAFTADHHFEQAGFTILLQ